MAGLIVLCALAGCGDDDPERVDPSAADTYVPAGPTVPRPPTEAELCDHPDAGDAGDARPLADDPRTLVLRLRDLPRGARFDSPMGVERITFEGQYSELLERSGFRQVVRGSFAIGRREPEPPPGAPPPPPSCLAQTGVDSAALTFEHERGADLAYEERQSLAGSTVGSGIGPVEARATLSASPVDVGDEATLIEAPSDRDGTINRTVVWRQGRLIGMVMVVGRGGRADRALAGRLAQRQATYLEAAD